MRDDVLGESVKAGDEGIGELVRLDQFVVKRFVVSKVEEERAISIECDKSVRDRRE